MIAIALQYYCRSPYTFDVLVRLGLLDNSSASWLVHFAVDCTLNLAFVSFLCVTMTAALACQQESEGGYILHAGKNQL